MGYVGYGNFIQPNIVDSMIYHPINFTEAMSRPPQEWSGKRTKILPMVMSGCVVVNLIISYPLLLTPVFIGFQTTSFGRDQLRPGSKRNYLMRTGTVGITIAIALLITEFSLVFSLFASVCGP